jgi:hypothetical protein
MHARHILEALIAETFFEKINPGDVAEVTSSFDGDTMMYHLLINGKLHSNHWSTNSAIEEAEKGGAVWKNDRRPEVSHIPRRGDYVHVKGYYRGEPYDG